MVESGRSPKLTYEVVMDTEIVRLELDLELRRLTIWAMRLDQEEPWRQEVELVKWGKGPGV